MGLNTLNMWYNLVCSGTTLHEEYCYSYLSIITSVQSFSTNSRIILRSTASVFIHSVCVFTTIQHRGSTSVLIPFSNELLSAAAPLCLHGGRSVPGPPVTYTSSPGGRGAVLFITWTPASSSWRTHHSLCTQMPAHSSPPEVRRVAASYTSDLTPASLRASYSHCMLHSTLNQASPNSAIMLIGIIAEVQTMIAGTPVHCVVFSRCSVHDTHQETGSDMHMIHQQLMSSFTTHSFWVQPVF